MTKFDQLFANVSDERYLSEAIEEILFEHKDEVLDLVRIQLERYGVDGSNKSLVPKYTPFTIRRKKELGQRTDHVTLKDEGDFHDSLFIAFFGPKDRNRYMETNARDSKLDELSLKYGDEIIDLNENSLKIVREEIVRPNLAKKLLTKWLHNI